MAAWRIFFSFCFLFLVGNIGHTLSLSLAGFSCFFFVFLLSLSLSVVSYVGDTLRHRGDGGADAGIAHTPTPFSLFLSVSVSLLNIHVGIKWVYRRAMD